MHVGVFNSLYIRQIWYTLNWFNHPVIVILDHTEVVSLLWFSLLVILVSVSLLFSPLYQDDIIKFSKVKKQSCQLLGKVLTWLTSSLCYVYLQSKSYLILVLRAEIWF